MSKKKDFLSFEEEKNHHKEFVRTFETRLDFALEKAKDGFKVNDQLITFQKMYEWVIKHLQKFEDSAYELTVEMLSYFIEKDQEYSKKTDAKTEIIDLFYTQLFTKIYNFFEIPLKHDHFQSTLMYFLAKKLIKYDIKTKEELIFALFGLMICQDIIKKTSFFFPEIIICFERVVAFFVKEISEKKIVFDKKLFNLDDKSVNKEEFLTMSKEILDTKNEINRASFYVITYKAFDKLLGAYLILFGIDANCDVTLANLWNIVQQIRDPVLLNYSTNTLKKLKNLMEYTKEKSDINIIKDKPLIRIKQLTPKYDDSDAELEKDYEEEIRKERKNLKKAVNKESKKAMRELAYDAMVLQMQKDKDREQQDERKKSSFKKFVKFMEEQQLEGKRIKTTQLQHKPRYKVKKSRLAGNRTDPNTKSSQD